MRRRGSAEGQSRSFWISFHKAPHDNMDGVDAGRSDPGSAVLGESLKRACLGSAPEWEFEAGGDEVISYHGLS